MGGSLARGWPVSLSLVHAKGRRGAVRDAAAATRELGAAFDLDRGKETLAEHCELFWRRHVVRLEENTRKGYLASWQKHLLPRVGWMRLRDITPAVVEELRADLAASGVGEAALRKALALLSGMMTAAVRWDRVDRNPFAVVGLPSGRRKSLVKPFAPMQIEALRAELMVRDDGVRHAVFVSAMGYGGVRPQEARALRWGDVGQRTVRVERAASGRSVKSTKNEKLRTGRLLPVLAADLALWREAHPDPGPTPGCSLPQAAG